MRKVLQISVTHSASGIPVIVVLDDTGEVWSMRMGKDSQENFIPAVWMKIGAPPG
jgi:hypothetical protein